MLHKVMQSCDDKKLLKMDSESQTKRPKMDEMLVKAKDPTEPY